MKKYRMDKLEFQKETITLISCVDAKFLESQNSAS